MALSQSALLEVLDALNASDSTDVIRKALQVMLQQLIDAEATAFIGAEPHERTDDRTTQRNGTRPKTITTTAGDVDLSITKLRQGSFFPSLLERRRRIDQALFAVVMEAYVSGTSRPQGRQPRQGDGCRHRDLQVRGLSDLRRARRGGRRLRRPLPGRAGVPLRVPRRHLLQSQGRWRPERQRLPGGVPGRRDRHRCHRRRAS